MNTNILIKIEIVIIFLPCSPFFSCDAGERATEWAAWLINQLWPNCGPAFLSLGDKSHLFISYVLFLMKDRKYTHSLVKK